MLRVSGRSAAVTLSAKPVPNAAMTPVELSWKEDTVEEQAPAQIGEYRKSIDTDKQGGMLGRWICLYGISSVRASPYINLPQQINLNFEEVLRLSRAAKLKVNFCRRGSNGSRSDFRLNLTPNEYSSSGSQALQFDEGKKRSAILG
ncbi:hypothetical protein RRG08_006167 [Elysia crispata]|uniref:Uncharacterized protein n=1 Tax=Elysia crispata TaxID=231223 RepID=A0AAE1E7L8_9GAST|nr:hypothetical protein RRG08_006167 [Elysia crispata]